MSLSCIFPWFCLLAIFYSYFGYPILLFLFTSLRREPSGAKVREPSYPDFAIIVAARNEENHIEDKILSSLSLIQKYEAHTSSAARLIVVSDGSTDKTENIVSKYSDQDVELIRSPQAIGKDKSLNKAIAVANEEILFFTDAKSRLDSDTLLKFAEYFSDESVGAVSTRDRVISENSPYGSDMGESLYVKYEMLLRSLESKFYSLIGLSGSGFAVRGELCSEIADNDTCDFSLLFEADDIICYYSNLKDEGAEFCRKVRTVLHGISTFFSNWNSSIFLRDPIFAWQIISHKIFRWLVPVFFLGFLASVSLHFCEHFLCSLTGYSLAFLLLLPALVYLFPLLRKNALVRLVLFFFISNLAILVAIFKFAKGDRVTSW